MSNALKAIYDQEDRFINLVEANKSGLDWKTECLYARQHIQKNDYAMQAAANNPQSLANAITNMASIGVSLNPATSYAYLVPRDRSICLDISFKGMVKLATDCGAIEYCKTELVHEGDTFEWNGPLELPTHKADVFGSERDENTVIGAYNIAKMPDGTYMTDKMTRKELDKVRAASKAANGPWKTWPMEMMKKAMTKRAFKSWPQTEARERMAEVIDVMNDSEGSAYTIDQQLEFFSLLQKGDAMALKVFSDEVGEAAITALYNSAEKGSKVKTKNRYDTLIKQAFEELSEIAINFEELMDSGELDEANLLLVETGEMLIPLIKESAYQHYTNELPKLK